MSLDDTPADGQPEPSARSASGSLTPEELVEDPLFLAYGNPRPTIGHGQGGLGIGDPAADFKGGFGPRSDSAEERQKLGKEVSPIYFVSSNLPPTLIIHGDADKLVPIQQSETFVKRAQETGAKARLVVKPGKEHGWANIEADIPTLADWFDEHLRGIKN